MQTTHKLQKLKKSATKNTKINEIYKYIQKLHFLEELTKTNRNLLKSTNKKNLQKYVEIYNLF